MATGDLLASHSRGHLFRIENRVSSEGSWYRLPRVASKHADAAEAAVRRIKPEAAGDPFELADGSIVDVAKRVPEARGVRSADGRSARDFWVIDIDDVLFHVRGDARERIPLPDPSDTNVSAVQAEIDGSVCLSGGSVAYCRRGDDDPWRPTRLAKKDGAASVVAIAGRTLFAVVSPHDQTPALVRVEIP